MENGPKSSLSELTEFIQAACLLRKEIIGRDKTVGFLNKKKKHHVIYALDTGVIVVNSDPVKFGPLSKDGQHGAGYIFPRDDNNDDPQIRLAAALTNYICYELHPKDAMFQLPSHFKETKRVYEAVARKVSAEKKMPFSAIAEKESSLVAKQIEGLKSNPDFVKSVEKLIITIADSEETLFDPTGEIVNPIIKKMVDKIAVAYGHIGSIEREIINYLKLATRRGLASIDQAAVKMAEQKQSPELAWAFEAADLEKRSFSEIVRHSTLENLWMARIGYAKHISKNANNQTDADALATLDLVNERLKKLSPQKDANDRKGKKALLRLIFITADKQLVRAVSQHQDHGVNTEFTKKYFASFAKKYVRHTTAFLAECLVETEDQSQEHKIDRPMVSWLDGFLGEKAGMTTFDYGTMVDYGYLKPKAETLAKRFQDNLGHDVSKFNKLFKQWDNIRTNASNREVFSGQKLRDPIVSDAIHQALNSFDGWKSLGLGKNVEKFIEETSNSVSYNRWEEFVISLTKPGASIVLADDSDCGRNPPDIRFDSLAHTMPIFTNLLGRGNYIEPNALLDDLRTIREDTNDFTPGNNALGYLNYIVLSAIFAKNSKWSVTYSLAQRAIGIVDYHSDRDTTITLASGSPVSGREAHYVAAVSKRLMARKFGDFEDAEMHLSEARLCLKKDKEDKTATSQQGLRFDIEELALSLSRYYCLRQEDKNAGKTKEWKLASESLLKSTALKLDVRKSLEAGRTSTIVNFATNAIQVAVINLCFPYKTINEPSAADGWKDCLDEMVALLDRITINGDKPPQNDIKHPVNRSFLIHSYMLAANLILDQSSTTFQAVHKHFSSTNIEKFAVTGYDSWRYKRLKDVCINLLR